MTEYRRILLDGAPVQVIRDGDALVAPDGRRVVRTYVNGTLARDGRG